MDETASANFTSLPRDILREVLGALPTSSIINIYSVNKAHPLLFDGPNGLWEHLTRQLYGWGTGVLPAVELHSVDWRTEFRVATHFKQKIRNNIMRPTKPESKVKSILNVDHFSLDYRCYGVIGLQGEQKLFPLPIGNFATAYYEVEVIRLEENGWVAVGGSLEYSEIHQNSLASYAYTSGGFICLECVIPSKSDKDFKVKDGDIMGFGINYAASSIFFTKNGKLIYETNTNNNQPLLELKNLYATVTMANHELEVNMGARPFKFNLLKYQQQSNSQQPIQPYSKLIQEHLLSKFACQETIEGRFSQNFFTSYFLHTIYQTSLPEFLHILLYGEIPENSGVSTSELKMDVIRWNLMRAQIYAHEKTLIFNPEESDELVSHMSDLADSLDIGVSNALKMFHQPGEVGTGQNLATRSVFPREPNFEEMDWKQKCMTVHEKYIIDFSRTTSGILRNYAEEIAALAYGYFEPPESFEEMLAIIELTRDRRDVAGWARRCMMDRLNIDEYIYWSEDLNILLMPRVMALRSSIAIPYVVAQRYLHLIEEKKQELETMKQIYGRKSDEITLAYEAFIKEITKLSTDHPMVFADPANADPSKGRMAIVADAMMFKEGDDEFLSELVLYGIYCLKMDPNQFSSAEDFVDEMVVQIKKLISDKEEEDHIMRLIDATKDACEIDELVGVAITLNFLTGSSLKVREDVSFTSTRDTLLNFMREYIEKNFDRSEKTSAEDLLERCK